MTNDKTKIWVKNGLIAAMYLALTMITPFSQGAIQFRVSESLNHLVVFNKKLMWGVLGGVILYNLLFSNLLDVVFGGGQTFLALGLSALIQKKVPDVKKRLAWNAVFFTVSMALIALMLKLTLGFPFWITYATTALSECIIMTISAPIMYLVGTTVKL